MDYRTLVLELLQKRKYPKLENHVVIDVYYKMIPMDYPSLSVLRYDRRFDNPEDVYVRDSKPFTMNFMVCVGDYAFYLHEIDKLNIESLQTNCITIKINRSYLDNVVLHQKSDTFEEEIYKFITLLNYDVPRVADVLNMGFFASTRFLPQRINLFAFKYSIEEINYQPLSEAEQLCFGPSSQTEIFPVRPIIGRLSECKSRSTLLSLNNNIEFSKFKYIDHFSTRYRTLIPLAYNPLENPIIT